MSTPYSKSIPNSLKILNYQSSKPHSQNNKSPYSHKPKHSLQNGNNAHQNNPTSTVQAVYNAPNNKYLIL